MMDMPITVSNASSVMELIMLILNLLLGGGLILTLITLRSYKMKTRGEALQATAQAEVVRQQADSAEIDNVDKIAKMWREQAESFENLWKTKEEQLISLCTIVEERKGEVHRLVTINTKIVKSLDKINADNYEKIIEQIKADINSAS